MRWLVLAMLAACYQAGDLPAQCDGSMCVDGPASDVPPGEVCVGGPDGLMKQTCFDPVPRTEKSLTGMYDTDLATNCDPPVDGRNDVCIVAARTLSVTGTLRPHGVRPLVLWAVSSIEVPADATIDVASHSTNLGAGANDLSCTAQVAGAIQNIGNPDVGSGGCGGTFAGLGGDGGLARNSNTSSIDVTCTPAVVPLEEVRGGCPGGEGGFSTAVSTPAAGASGGAVYLMTNDKIRVAGIIDARGASGRNALGNNSVTPGGSGGGSGGLIGFESPSAIVLDGAILIAAGGGGSSGAGFVTNTIVQGNGGETATVSPPAFALESGETVPDNSGGAGGTNGAAGGNVAMNSIGGGGGGAGGVGYIRIFSPMAPSTTGTKVLPPFN